MAEEMNEKNRKTQIQNKGDEVPLSPQATDNGDTGEDQTTEGNELDSHGRTRVQDNRHSSPEQDRGGMGGGKKNAPY